MKRLLCFLQAFIIAVACTQPVEEEKYGEIAGIVYDNNVGEPISVAQVKLSPGGNSTVTGTDGSFSFTNIQPGSYTISVTKKGYSDGTNTVTVVAGRRAECNILINRIPAFVTADKNELDFGDNTTLTSLSFNIVNSSYENLSWHIDYDKSSSSFIAEISPESGTIQYGKTAAIVVKIDREKLKAGENVSTIVVVSDNGDGSSEVKIKAIGQEQAKATVNLKEVTDITASTAIAHAEMSFAGIPAYEERGFVYSETDNPSIDVCVEKITTTVDENSSFSYMLKNLSCGKKYYVKAFAINKLGVSYSNQESFTTVATVPVVSIYSVDHLDATNKTAALHGSIDSVGDPIYSEKGFVYCEGRNTPTINDSYVKVSGTGTGSYEASISELQLGSTYCARAYAKNEGGIAYSEKTIEFTLTGTSPIVSIGEVTDINLNKLTAVFHGSLDSIGSPAATEKGFVYSTDNQSPTSSDLLVAATDAEAGTYYATISQLILGKTYYVRAYAKNEAGIVYSDEAKTFSTKPSMASVSIRSVTNVNLNNKSALFHGSVDFSGDPSFTEKGFVYSPTNETPTLNDLVVVVPGNEVGTYETTVTDLVLNNTYYVRAYATNAAGTVLSETVASFDLVEALPIVTTGEASNIDVDNKIAVLHGSISDVGNPAYTERGFVLSTEYEMPSIYDQKILVSGTGPGDFEYRLTDFSTSVITYVRAYAKNNKGVAYGDTIILFDPAFIEMEDYIILRDSRIAVQKKDIGMGGYSSMEALCRNSSVGGFTDWRIPTKEELAVLYNQSLRIGGFDYDSFTGYYWCSDLFSGEPFHWVIWFYDGSLTNSMRNDKARSCHARCVRTLEQQSE